MTMTSLLDERIDRHRNMDFSAYGHRGGAYFIPRAPYKGIANTIVQLISWSAAGVIAAAQATRSVRGGLREVKVLEDERAA